MCVCHPVTSRWCSTNRPSHNHITPRSNSWFQIVKCFCRNDAQWRSVVNVSKSFPHLTGDAVVCSSRFYGEFKISHQRAKRHTFQRLRLNEAKVKTSVWRSVHTTTSPPVFENNVWMEMRGGVSIFVSIFAAELQSNSPPRPSSPFVSSNSRGVPRPNPTEQKRWKNHSPTFFFNCKKKTTQRSSDRRTECETPVFVCRCFQVETKNLRFLSGVFVYRSVALCATFRKCYDCTPWLKWLVALHMRSIWPIRTLFPVMSWLPRPYCPGVAAFILTASVITIQFGHLPSETSVFSKLFFTKTTNSTH